jgi:geranyl-CoA carboxylase beta subunit
MLTAAAKNIVDTYDAESTALFATARLWDDGIIDPRDTRRVVGMCLDVCKEAQERQLRPNSFGVARM